ncbi:RmlC-like cupin [Mycena kentingensis (nom. inval.)]|nr:RmlC-like cupin [Mycena kentingensis (nom. inval.)]
MFTSKGALAALALAASVSAAAVSDAAAAAATIEKLRLAPVSADRINILNTDDQFVFDFFSPNTPASKGAGGRIITANAATFPAVVGQGSAMAVGILDPCSMNTPHTHPRATEIQISVNTTYRTGMIAENGARFVTNRLSPGQMTVFPQGSIHFEFNDGCSPAMFVAAFNSEDPGVMSIAQRFLGLPPDVVAATLGDLGVEEVVGIEKHIPDNVAVATDECLKRCGLHRPEQPTTQRQPKVPGNTAGSESGSGSNDGKKQGGGYDSGKKQGDNDGKKSGGYGSNDGKKGGDNNGGYNNNGGHGAGKTHTIQVGANGLTFTPSNITADIGDVVIFEFHPKNHTVTQSSFAEPCKPLAQTSANGVAGFKSGFVPVAPNATAPFPTFNITIKDLEPIWGYCGQQGPPVHCTEGMVFSINSKEDTPKTFAAFQALAKKGKVASSAAPSASGYAKVAAALASDSDDNSNGGSSKPSPALIALIAINGTLLIGLIAMSVLYIRKRRAAARVSRHRQLYTSIGANGEEIFVAPEKPEGSRRSSPSGVPRSVRAAPQENEEDEVRHGLTHGPYYDPHEAKGYHDRE